MSKATGSSNGRTSPFEGEYLGSNPSPVALLRILDRLPAQAGLRTQAGLTVGLRPLKASILVRIQVPQQL